VCTGSGAAGLASAISVVDVGGDVFVAESFGDHAPSPGPNCGRPHPWLSADTTDAETVDYLAAVSSDLGPLRRTNWDVDVPVRTVREPVPVESTRTIPPFVGTRLRDWNARCLASPSGYLYTKLSDWQSTTLQTDDGELIEVAEIGAMRPDPDNVGGSVLDWLGAQAHDRGIDVHPDCSLQRLVFEEGAVVGAVFITSDGPLAVRARHGVTVEANGPRTHASLPYQLPAEGSMRVCMVGQHVSRFGRVELLTSEALIRLPPSTCRPSNRQLHANLHETHGQSHTWRCGKMHGYPPASQ
jgi:hypothetical protein